MKFSELIASLHVLLSVLFYCFIGICNQHILHFFYSFTIFVSFSELEVRFLTQTTYLWYVNTSDTGTYLKWEGSVLLHVNYIISFSCDNHYLNIWKDDSVLFYSLLCHLLENNCISKLLYTWDWVVALSHSWAENIAQKYRLRHKF